MIERSSSFFCTVDSELSTKPIRSANRRRRPVKRCSGLSSVERRASPLRSRRAVCGLRSVLIAPAGLLLRFADRTRFIDVVLTMEDSGASFPDTEHEREVEYFVEQEEAFTRDDIELRACPRRGFSEAGWIACPPRRFGPLQAAQVGALTERSAALCLAATGSCRGYRRSRLRSEAFPAGRRRMFVCANLAHPSVDLITTNSLKSLPSHVFAFRPVDVITKGAPRRRRFWPESTCIPRMLCLTAFAIGSRFCF